MFVGYHHNLDHQLLFMMILLRKIIDVIQKGKLKSRPRKIIKYLTTPLPTKIR